jgi:hypothetical protein
VAHEVYFARVLLGQTLYKIVRNPGKSLTPVVGVEVGVDAVDPEQQLQLQVGEEHHAERYDA